MREDCEGCGEFAECKDGLCVECRLEGIEDETSEETQKEEDKEGEAKDSRGSSRSTSQDEEGL